MQQWDLAGTMLGAQPQGIARGTIGGTPLVPMSAAAPRDRLVHAIMNGPGQMMDSPSAMDYGPTAFDPNAIKDFRAQNESKDPWAIAGNRWSPDKVDMPINSSGILNVPNIAPPATPTSLARAAAAPPPQFAPGGYRPGQVPGGGAAAPTGGLTPPPQNYASQTHTPAAAPAMQRLQARNPLWRRPGRGMPRRFPAWGAGPR